MPERSTQSYTLGLQGEQAAERYLSQRGMTCLERRYRSPYGEIDLIMLSGETLVFVEVKARRAKTLYETQLTVTPLKQRRINQTALNFISQHPEHAHRLMRFDIVALTDDCILHSANAFQGVGW